MKKIILASVTMAMVMTAGSALAANSLNAGAMGLTIALNDAGVTPGNTGNNFFMVGGKYFMAKDMALTAGAGLSIRGGDDKGTDIGFSVGMRKYLKVDDFAPFIGARFQYASGGDSGTTKYTGMNLGAEAGAEYFFSKQFSMEGTIGFGYKSLETTTGATTTKGTRIGTESIGIAANFYF